MCVGYAAQSGQSCGTGGASCSPCPSNICDTGVCQ
jgi:hypothetical protein